MVSKASAAPALVLSHGPGGLGATRSLGRLGVPVTAVVYDHQDPVRYSRLASRTLFIEGNEWLLPVGAGVSKTFRTGRRPMKIGVELQYYVVSPDRFGPEWLLKINFIPFVSTRLLQ